MLYLLEGSAKLEAFLFILVENSEFKDPKRLKSWFTYPDIISDVIAKEFKYAMPK